MDGGSLPHEKGGDHIPANLTALHSLALPSYSVFPAPPISVFIIIYLFYFESDRPKFAVFSGMQL